MPGVEIEDVGSLGVEHETNGPVTLLLLAPHHARDVVTMAEIIAETLTLVVEENTTLTTESWKS
jgi:hypothetical protein